MGDLVIRVSPRDRLILGQLCHTCVVLLLGLFAFLLKYWICWGLGMPTKTAVLSLALPDIELQKILLRPSLNSEIANGL